MLEIVILMIPFALFALLVLILIKTSADRDRQG